jgi:hypothetical protein
MKSFFIALICMASFQFATARTIRVNAYGGGDFTRIQEGITDANAGDTVLVYPAEYPESIDFLGKDITVASLYLTTADTSYIAWTIINGEHERNRLVKFVSGETRNAALIGFTITNAYDDIGLATVKVTGLGVYIENSSPTVDHNYIENNEFGDWYISGGGMALINSGARVSNNRIRHNEYAYEGGGIYVSGGSHLIIENNRIEHHYLISGYGVSFGGGMYISNSDHITIKNNIIQDNYQDYGDAAALYLLNSEFSSVLNNIFRNNGGSCDVQYYGSSGDFINNLIYNDTWPNHTRLVITGSNLNLINSTFVNAGSTSVSAEHSVLRFVNTLLYGNSDSAFGKQIRLNESVADFRNCNIKGNISGFEVIGNSSFTYTDVFDENPLFSGDSIQPYGLAEGSPCINRGVADTSGLNLPLTDLAGNARMVEGRVDIGAYEYPLLTPLAETPGDNVLQVFPNPAQDWIQIGVPDGWPADKLKLRLFRSDGTFVTEQKFSGSTNLFVGNYSPGLYLLVVNTGLQRYTTKLIVE